MSKYDAERSSLGISSSSSTATKSKYDAERQSSNASAPVSSTSNKSKYADERSQISKPNNDAESFNNAQQKFGQVSADPSQSPVMQAANQYADAHPNWNGVIDNPIGRPIIKGAQKVGAALDKFERVTGLHNVAGAARGLSTPDQPTHNADGTYLGEYKALGQNAVEGAKNLVKSTIQGFLHPDDATKKFDATVDKGLEHTNPATRVAGKMVASGATDPLSWVPLPINEIVQGVRGLKAAGEAGLVGQAVKDVKEAPLPDYSNISLTNSGKAAEIPKAAEAMKQSWFGSLFGNQGIGISAVKDTNRISKDPLTTEGAIVNNSIKNDAQGIKDEIAAKARAIYQNHVDQLSPLKKISGETYNTAMDSTRSNNIANNIIHDKFVTPEGNVVGPGLGEIFKKVARGQDSQFVDYLTLRHAVTRMDRGEQVYADSLNMTAEKAQARLQVLEQRHPGFAGIAKEWDGFNANVLQHYGVNEGLISSEAFKALQEKNPNYSPMNRQFSRSEKPGRSFLAKSTSSSFSGQKAPIKEVSKLGSARNIVDPRKSTIENVGAWVNASMRNRTMQSMVDAIKTNPDAFKGVAEIVQQPKGGTNLNKVLMDGGTDDFVEHLNQDYTNLFKKSNVDGENVVRAMVKGQPVYMKVHDPEIVKTLIGMGPQSSNVLIDAMSAFSNATKRGATGLLSPVFAVKGATMDLVQSAIQAKNPAKQAAYTLYAILSGVGDRLNIPGLKNMAEEYRRSGGEYSAALKGDRKLNKSVSSLRRDPFLSPRGITKGVKAVIKAPFQALEGVGNIAENAPRIAASKLELNRLGGARTESNVRQAMSAGREATVNYSRKGALSRDIEAFVPYNNAAVQGTYRILKGLKNNPVRTAGAIGALAILPKLYEYAQFHNDPDYQNLPARERMRFLIVHKNDDGTFTKIPMDPAYNSFGEMTIEALRHFKDQDPNAFKGTADALANAWTPPAITGAAQGITQGGGLDKSIAGAINSTVAAPFVATVANQSFTGAPIVSKSVEDRSTQYQYDEKTSSIAKALTKYTGMAPMKIDYLLRAYGGDPARLLLPLTSDVGGGNVRNTLLKNFIVDPTLTNNLTNDFYNAKDKITRAFRDFQEVGAKLPPWFSDGMYKTLTSTANGSLSKTLSGLSSLKKDISNDKSLTAKQKTDKIRETQQKINHIYIDINSQLAKQKVPMK